MADAGQELCRNFCTVALNSTILCFQVRGRPHPTTWYERTYLTCEKDGANSSLRRLLPLQLPLLPGMHLSEKWKNASHPRRELPHPSSNPAPCSFASNNMMCLYQVGNLSEHPEENTITCLSDPCYVHTVSRAAVVVEDYWLTSNYSTEISTFL
jgi:hypothetical protein